MTTWSSRCGRRSLCRARWSTRLGVCMTASAKTPTERAKPLSKHLRIRLLVRRRQDKRPCATKLLDLGEGLGDRAKSEDHARAEPGKDNGPIAVMSDRFSHADVGAPGGLGVGRRIFVPSFPFGVLVDPSPRTSGGAIQTAADGALVVLRHNRALGFITTIEEGRLERV